MMVKRAYLIFCITGMLCIVMCSCQIHGHNELYFRKGEALKNVRSVAVLPFHNLSEKTNAGIIITSMLMSELMEEGGFRVVKYGDIRQFFLQRRATSVSTIDTATLHALRQEFRVEVVIIGTVFRYEEDDGSQDRGRQREHITPLVSISSTILDTKSGRILGKGDFMEKGSAQGYLLSDKSRQGAFILARQLAKRLIDKIAADRA